MKGSAYSEVFLASSARIKCCGSASMMLHDGDGGDDDGMALLSSSYNAESHNWAVLNKLQILLS